MTNMILDLPFMPQSELYIVASATNVDQDQTTQKVQHFVSGFYTYRSSFDYKKSSLMYDLYCPIWSDNMGKST